MMDPRKLLDEIDMNIDSREHSIDDHLENTSDFRNWAQRKRKGTNLDPEYIKPTQVSDFSCYDQWQFFNTSELFHVLIMKSHVSLFRSPIVRFPILISSLRDMNTQMTHTHHHRFRV